LTGVTEWNLAGGYDTKSHRGHTHPKEGRAVIAQAPELAAVVARLEKVERQNRRLKRVGVVVLALAVAGMVMGQAMPRARIVEAEEFVLKDAARNVRAELAAFKDGPALTLLDENGKSRATLAVDKPGPMLLLHDENDKTIWRQP